MDNQHRLIKGYGECDQGQIDLMNEVKQAGVIIETLVAKLKENPDTDKRWLAIGVTHLQQGGMALTRSVAKPTFFF